MDDVTARVKIAPFGSHAMTVSFEPSGMTYDLQPGEWFIVEVCGVRGELIEVGHNPEYIAIGTDGLSPMRIYDHHGQLIHETEQM
jgi:hypothetical protein